LDRRAWDRDGMLLADINADGAETRYVYDAAGNLTAVTDAQGNVTRIDYGEDNLPATVTDALGHATHSRYDAAGRLLERNDALGRSTRYAYDGKGRLATAVRTFPTSRIVARYSYDAFGRRIAKRVDEQRWAEGETPPSVGQAHAGELTLFVWDGDVMVQEVHADRTVTYVYEPGSFVPLAQVKSFENVVDFTIDPSHLARLIALEPQLYPVGVDGHVQAWQSQLAEQLEKAFETRWSQQLLDAENRALSDDVNYYQCDHLGTPLELVKGDGCSVWTLHYRAWGGDFRRLRHAEPQPLRFQGQYRDSETGLSYNWHRYYDPDVGRFITQDPIGLAGGANQYVYSANPIVWIDPLGLRKKLNPNATYDTFAGNHAKPLANKRMPINSCFAGKVMKDGDLPEHIRQKYPHGVPFNMFGFPDFSRYAEKTVHIGAFKADNLDFRKANEAAFGKNNPFGDKAPDGYTWHHHQENGKLQLIPKDIHDAVKHTGGASLAGCRTR
jgi:RHS repeat-associated protein